MKRFAALALFLCIGLFTIGCAKKADEPAKPADKPDATADADADADADDGSAAKPEEKTE